MLAQQCNASHDSTRNAARVPMAVHAFERGVLSMSLFLVRGKTGSHLDVRDCEPERSWYPRERPSGITVLADGMRK